MAFETDYCSCGSCTAISLLSTIKKIAITIAVLGPLGIALHFWLKKRRLTKLLSKVQGKSEDFLDLLFNEAKRFKKKYIGVHHNPINTDDFIKRNCVEQPNDGITPTGDIIKRLELTVETLTQGMKITNKRLLQLSEQVLYLRRKLQEQSQNKHQNASSRENCVTIN